MGFEFYFSITLREKKKYYFKIAIIETCNLYISAVNV